LGSVSQLKSVSCGKKIWRNSSQRHQNKETFPEGYLLEFCEIFTPVVFRKIWTNKTTEICSIFPRTRVKGNLDDIDSFEKCLN
jgi:hypothetical protein